MLDMGLFILAVLGVGAWIVIWITMYAVVSKAIREFRDRDGK